MLQELGQICRELDHLHRALEQDTQAVLRLDGHSASRQHDERDALLEELERQVPAQAKVSRTAQKRRVWKQSKPHPFEPPRVGQATPWCSS